MRHSTRPLRRTVALGTPSKMPTGDPRHHQCSGSPFPRAAPRRNAPDADRRLGDRPGSGSSSSMPGSPCWPSRAKAPGGPQCSLGLRAMGLRGLVRGLDLGGQALGGTAIREVARSLTSQGSRRFPCVSRPHRSRPYRDGARARVRSPPETPPNTFVQSWPGNASLASFPRIRRHRDSPDTIDDGHHFGSPEPHGARRALPAGLDSSSAKKVVSRVMWKIRGATSGACLIQ
jgi:hypothetical protein